MSTGFKAVAGPDARVLVLGTLPGRVSLERGEYYAQPRNVFWRVMGALVGAGPELPYEERLRRLVAHRIALWDVCRRASRQGSLDAAIRSATVRPNDLREFLRSHPKVQRICFNGEKASRLFRRHVLPALDARSAAIPLAVLPSTSPAHAAMPFEEKLARWRAALHAGGRRRRERRR